MAHTTALLCSMLISRLGWEHSSARSDVLVTSKGSRCVECNFLGSINTYLYVLYQIIPCLLLALPSIIFFSTTFEVGLRFVGAGVGHVMGTWPLKGWLE